ncbi:hypothetical protein Lesp02_33330 [Lentzea sp. NBRC 105346]|nr:hypothetical protein Lesp02_33330 [Lentzea sp. NBRC 105346]
MLEDGIRPIFEHFKCGDPDRVDSMISYLTEAKYVLGKDLREHLGGAQLDMDGWHGGAADDFRTWLLKLEDAINLLADCIDALMLILRSYKAIVLAMRSDVLQLVSTTLKGIEEAEASDWKIALAVVGAVAGVVAALPTGGASLSVTAVAASMVAGAAGVANEMMDADSENGVIQEMIKIGWSMIGKINGESGRIQVGLIELSGYVTGGKLAEVRPDRPVVITAPSFDPGSFGMTDEAQGKHKRRPTDTTDLVPEPKRHEDGPYDKAGGVIAEEYDQYEEQGPA